MPITGKRNTDDEDFPSSQTVLDFVASPTTCFDKMELVIGDGWKRSFAEKSFFANYITKEVAPSIAQHWHDIGLKLLDKKAIAALDNIAKEGSASDCCRKMLKMWIDAQSSTIPYYQLVEAIKAVKLDSVASDLEQQLFLRKFVVDTIW